MSTNQKGRKRQVWMSIGLAGVLVTNGCLPYAVPANEVQAVETTQSERETKVTTIPAGSTFASIFPSSKLALQVAMEIYPQTHPDKIDVKKEVTQAELDRVTIIEDDPALGDPIGNIEGVQYLRNLEDLWVGTTSGFSGYIENLDVLSNLTKLKVLAVKNQAISDISGIKNLTNLTYLNLSENKITDASPIAGLTKLEHIDFARENRIQSLAPFRQLTHLKKLFLSTSVSDFRPLQHLPLIQDSNATWVLVGNITLPDAYVGEPVFMQAFDPTGEQVLFGGVMVDGKWEGMKAYDGQYATYSKVGMGNVTFTQSLSEPSGTDRYIRVDFKQRVLPAKATVQPVTVRYVDDQGEVLAPEERLTGVLDEAYEAKAKAIAGYRLVATPANQTGTFGTEAQTVTFIYAQETAPSLAQPVTVQYVDDQGQALT
ncbi:MucBP domain-containing protein, partial [Listeria grandensis]|uniref:MucBP domain-containing protein n=1 Tax=Listeria grandensis TaxID=1494963 RepID=UPI00164CDECD